MTQTTLCVPLEVKPESCSRLCALIEALRCREDSLALVEGATTSAALAGGDGIIRGTLSGPGFEAEWACTYLEGPDGWLITSGLTDYRRK